VARSRRSLIFCERNDLALRKRSLTLFFTIIKSSSSSGRLHAVVSEDVAQRATKTAGAHTRVHTYTGDPLLFPPPVLHVVVLCRCTVQAGWPTQTRGKKHNYHTTCTPEGRLTCSAPRTGRLTSRYKCTKPNENTHTLWLCTECRLMCDVHLHNLVGRSFNLRETRSSIYIVDPLVLRGSNCVDNVCVCVGTGKSLLARTDDWWFQAALLGMDYVESGTECVDYTVVGHQEQRVPRLAARESRRRLRRGQVLGRRGECRYIVKYYVALNKYCPPRPLWAGRPECERRVFCTSDFVSTGGTCFCVQGVCVSSSLRVSFFNRG